MNNKIEIFFRLAKKWKTEFNLLRELILQNKNLQEEYKWMHPCYTLNGKNIVLIHGFKEYCALLFHKGALLKDDKKILFQQTENVQSARQIRFTNADEIKKLAPVIKRYIKEAIDIEKSGQKVELKKATDYPVPEELQKILNNNKAFQKAFYALTPGRQKGYLFYFNQAKQSKTREARIEKYFQQILSGKGLDD